MAFATFAGGCFWCTEASFLDIHGVEKVVSGYAGGKTENPSYEDVCFGNTGHREAVQVEYDPKKVSFPKLLDLFWRSIDPADEDGQFTDKGEQYTTAIFYHDEHQKKEAETSKKAIERGGRFPKIATQILPFKNFYPAEENHQQYSRKCPLRYKLYKMGSGRGARLEKMWG